LVGDRLGEGEGGAELAFGAAGGQVLPVAFEQDAVPARVTAGSRVRSRAVSSMMVASAIAAAEGTWRGARLPVAVAIWPVMAGRAASCRRGMWRRACVPLVTAEMAAVAASRASATWLPLAR
jgi:hypothetical protein